MVMKGQVRASFQTCPIHTFTSFNGVPFPFLGSRQRDESEETQEKAEVSEEKEIKVFARRRTGGNVRKQDNVRNALKLAISAFGWFLFCMYRYIYTIDTA